MKRLLNLFLQFKFAALLVMSLLSCSQQWREGDAQMDGNGVMDRIAEIEQSATLSGGTSRSDLDFFLSLTEQTSSTIYFADSYHKETGKPSPMGPPISIFSVAYLDFLGLDMEGPLLIDNVDYVSLIYVDDPASNQSALLIDLQLHGESDDLQTFVFTNQEGRYIQDGEYIVFMKNSRGEDAISLRSYDLVEDSNELKAVIQLKVFDFNGGDSEADEDYIGQFSTLVGFGG